MRPDDWYCTQDLTGFLSHAGSFLRSRPDLHTVALTVTETLRTSGLRAYGDEAPVFGVLELDGQVRAAYFRTPPFRLNVTPLTPAEAESLAAHLVALGHSVPGVIAARDTAEAFVAAWRRHTGARAAVSQRQRLYRLGNLTVPHPLPPGRARAAGKEDRDRLIRWYGEFVESVGDHAARDAAGWADSRISYGGVTFWEGEDGTPLSMAGVTPLVAGQVRIAPVYTPAGLRGRGYAGAVTAQVSRAVLASGVREVLLFTDLANQTSNSLYQRIGYRAVADFTAYDFRGARDF
ncbi:GNAT family N-acetyltransferase [Streptomyces sp. ISL-22]|uniref:GNAT family N-acetyltransferase n=1 Tax=unclassified Streptomyces TaxID=2593676 RepID=UPI001BE755E7|nr:MULTISPECIES: GNAT family N-acetyltransferase [unclassified Streptomyces]MBT2418365.1 GNAT family N-acetyltransferase [Streptomyces sp. ISL-24]MBT2438374.1 GNAT family N-acetyltransferase [Streptomyces sp. ISL-22]